MLVDFGRVITAMVTPFDEHNNVDWGAVKTLANYLADNGSDAIVVSGTTGETPNLSEEEKVKLFETVFEAVGDRVKVIAGTGTNNTALSIRLSREAQRIGLHGVMLVVPYYNKPSQEGLYQHFKAIAEEIDLPVMLYNVPSRTVTNLAPETVARLAEIDNIVALKEAAGNMDRVSVLRRSLPEDFAIYSGDDSLTLPMLALGCRGVVSVASHLVGNQLQEMIDSFQQGDVAKANAIHLKLFPLFKVLFVTTNPVPIKTALNLKGIKVGGLRLPLHEATDEEVQVIKNTLTELGLLD